MKPTDQKRLKAAVEAAFIESVPDIRAVYQEFHDKHHADPHWWDVGYYDKQLARRYSRVLAPRILAHLSAEDAA